MIFLTKKFRHHYLLLSSTNHFIELLPAAAFGMWFENLAMFEYVKLQGIERSIGGVQQKLLFLEISQNSQENACNVTYLKETLAGIFLWILRNCFCIELHKCSCKALVQMCTLELVQLDLDYN